MAIKYTKLSLNTPNDHKKYQHDPPKDKQIWIYFWYENIPSGNPVENFEWL
jgi:hypothetical protein